MPDAILPEEPPPGAVVAEAPLALLGGVHLTLSNGMRVVLQVRASRALCPNHISLQYACGSRATCRA